MSTEKLKELKDQLDLVIRMVEERKREKRGINYKYWDEVLKQYRRIRGLLDQVNPDVSKISRERSTAYGLFRMSYDNLLIYQDDPLDDPLGKEMSKVIRLLEALDKEEDK